MTEYITRAEWNARQPSGGRNQINRKPRGTAIHWNGPSCAASIRDHKDCPKFVRGIQDFHMDGRKWSDIAYTMFACPHGYLFEGRGRNIGTAANGTTYGNLNYYAIYLMWGEGDGRVPEAMLDAAADGVKMCQSWGAGPAVTTHNALFSTECPGFVVTELVAQGRFSNGSKPSASKPKPSSKPKPVSKPKPAGTKAPAFPLQKGHWYGVESKNPNNHSGFYKKDQAGIRRWQTQMRDVRKWRGIGEIDGVFGEKSETVCKQFQEEKDIRVDGAVGAVTWKASWTADIT